MQLTPLLLTLTPLLSLVSATACVAGGPADQVSYAKGCCYGNAGTWYQFYDVQAICVLPEFLSGGYKYCVNTIPNSQLDTTCIPGDGGPGLYTSTWSSTTPRITFTAAV